MGWTKIDGMVMKKYNNKGAGMKIYVYKSNGGKLMFHDCKFESITLADEVPHYYIGELDLDIQPPKKTVRKEVEIKDRCCYHNSSLAAVSAFVPANAKNIKITYEVDE